jgi:hypothetical protein
LAEYLQSAEPRDFVFCGNDGKFGVVRTSYSGQHESEQIEVGISVRLLGLSYLAIERALRVVNVEVIGYMIMST